MQPLVPGFTITGQLSSGPTVSTWTAVRIHDDRRIVMKIVRVSDVSEARARAVHVMGMLDRIDNEHLVRPLDAIALVDSALAMVLDEVAGGTLADVLCARGPLSPGEAITTVAPLFRALADLHAAGMVHGDLAPEKVLFTADGRPLIGDLGVAHPVGPQGISVDGSSGFVAPELVAGAAPSPASDVYSMAAIGWFCLTGAAPVPATTGEGVTVNPETPPRLVQVLSSCLCADPTMRPSAGLVASEVFEAASAEPVNLGSGFDPAAEITRRIRESAVSAAPPAAPPSRGQRHRLAVIVAAVALLVAAVLGGGAAWFFRLQPGAGQPMAAQSGVRPVVQPVVQPSRASSTAKASRLPSPPATTPQPITDVVTAPDSPRIAPAGLLQALVDARALAYVARNPALLDLVYAPGAARAVLDRSNVATALRNGATYLGLVFVVKDAAFLDGTSNTARVRATIVTPAYQTGQPDGRKVTHQHEIVGPSVFTLEFGPDGWRILGLAAP